MYQVQFISSGIVAFSSHDKGLCRYFIDSNNYAPDKPVVDPDTGEVIGYEQGECLGLFKLIKINK